MSIRYLFDLNYRDRPAAAGLRNDVGDAVAVRIAVAWFTHHGLARMLAVHHQQGDLVEVITTFKDDLTDPAALAVMLDAGVPIRIWNENNPCRLMHAKVYACKMDDAGPWAIWMGSANATTQALASNAEGMVRIEHAGGVVPEDIESFFSSVSDRSSLLTQAMLDRYRTRYQAARRPVDESSADDADGGWVEPIAVGHVAAADRGTSPLLTASWDQYRRKMLARWSEVEQYLDCVSFVRPLLFSDAGHWDWDRIKAIYGMVDLHHADLLGNMRANRAAAGRLLDDPEAQRRLSAIFVRGAEQGDKHAAWAAYLDLTAIPGIKMSVGSRLTAIAFPQHMLVCSRKSHETLADMHGVTTAELGDPSGGYLHFAQAMQRIWSSPWHSAPRPKDDVRAQAIWDNRCALIDIFMADYRDTWDETVAA